MNLSVIGSGYVGSTIAACFADVGHEVVNIDIDESIVETINAGEPPIHEDGLADRFAEHAGSGSTGRLRATTDYDEILETDVTFLALPTPSNEDGGIDRSIIQAGAERLGETLFEKADRHTVVVKSTVVPGTTEDCLAPTIAEASGKTLGDDLGVGMNPEFQREGTAVDDFLNPDKVVLGADDARTAAELQAVFEPLVDAALDDPATVQTGTREAEMMKYANNAFLAAKVSLANDLGNVCKEHSVDTYEIADAMGFDSRIQRAFLNSGLGWGGSCFPKDTNAIIAAARERGYEPPMLNAAVEVNDLQPERLLDLLDEHVDVAGEHVAVLGLAFKPGTDDVRNTRAVPVIDGLRERGAEVVAHDPVAIENMRRRYPDLSYSDTPGGALDDVTACLVVTDWPEYSDLDEEFERMKRPVVIDGRRSIDRRDGLEYEGLTW